MIYLEPLSLRACEGALYCGIGVVMIERRNIMTCKLEQTLLRTRLATSKNLPTYRYLAINTTFSIVA